MNTTKRIGYVISAFFGSFTERELTQEEREEIRKKREKLPPNERGRNYKKHESSFHGLS
jgi:hypothetical protein